MLSIVMLIHDRPRLTRQALESLAENTRRAFNLTVWDDGSSPENWQALSAAMSTIMWQQGAVQWQHTANTRGPGVARNDAITASALAFGRSGLLYSSDSDAFFLSGWDETLLKCWNAPERAQERFEALGLYAHPFQRRGRLISNPGAMAGHSIAELDALGLFSWLMSWETWDKHGPFAPSPAVNGSEDWEYCQRIRRAGGKVGVVEPALVINAGVTSSDGKLCPGASLLWDQDIPPGVILE